MLPWNCRIKFVEFYLRPNYKASHILFIENPVWYMSLMILKHELMANSSVFLESISVDVIFNAF